MNPHKKETGVVYYLDDEKDYDLHRWYNTDLWVEAGGLALIIGTISFSAANSANGGFRLIDENNEPLTPYRTPTNSRNAAHFTAELNPPSRENLAHITFHMIVNCKYVKLQVYPDDTLGGDYAGVIVINRAYGNYTEDPAPDRPWSHKPISTMTAIPLLPHYQGGANTVFTYPTPRTRKPRMPEGDKAPKSSGPT